MFVSLDTRPEGPGRQRPIGNGNTIPGREPEKIRMTTYKNNDGYLCW